MANGRGVRRTGGLLGVAPRDVSQLRRYASPPPTGTPVQDDDVPDFIRYSWRWNSPEALRYELDRAQAKQREAANGGRLAVGVATGGALVSKFNPVAGKALGAAAAGLGGLGQRDEVHFGREQAALSRRLAALEGAGRQRR